MASIEIQIKFDGSFGFISKKEKNKFHYKD